LPSPLPSWHCYKKNHQNLGGIEDGKHLSMTNYCYEEGQQDFFLEEGWERAKSFHPYIFPESSYDNYCNNVALNACIHQMLLVDSITRC
jgi:hypothetical protein